MIDWNQIFQNLFTHVLTAIGGILAGKIFEKKQVKKGIERKNTVYQGIVDTLEPYTHDNYSILDRLEVEPIINIVNDDYKNAIPPLVKEKCNELITKIHKYNDISAYEIARDIIIKIFEDGFTEIYGGTACGKRFIEIYDDVIEEDVIYGPIEIINTMDMSRAIDELLAPVCMYNDEVIIDRVEDIREPIYGQLKEIYACALNYYENGKKYKLPEQKIKIQVLPKEYISYKYDFFGQFNNKIATKKELKEDIMYGAQFIVQEMKDIINRIVVKYEVEEL